jgi:hypothetical protein
LLHQHIQTRLQLQDRQQLLLTLRIFHLLFADG